MDPTELRMNLASLQRIDPYISGILMSSPQVALYKYVGTEWEKTNIEGTLFVYERKCEPRFGFLILNRLSSTNLIQPITKDIELQDKTPFLLYKTKDIFGIWFYEQANCKNLYQMINQVINKVKHGNKKTEKGSGKNGEISLADLLNNANSKNNKIESPGSGEKLLRLLSINEPRNEQPEKSNGDGSVAAFFAQVSQASTIPTIPIFTDPAIVSSLEKPEMPPLPVSAKAASELESDMKEKKKQQKTPKKAETNKRADENNSSYAAVVKEAPQLMSPMVFAGQDQSPRTPLIQNLATPPVNLATPPVNGNSAPMPQLTPLTEPQLLQAFQHLLRTDRSFVTKLHQAYVESLNVQLN